VRYVSKYLALLDIIATNFIFWVVNPNITTTFFGIFLPKPVVTPTRKISGFPERPNIRR
jgi:hypothetical protein